MTHGKPDIAIIGGSGLYRLDEFSVEEHRVVSTPYGDPSEKIIIGKLSDIRVAFLPRHGAAHQLSPTAIPQRANIYALKEIGVRRVVAISAVGSLRSDYEPGHLVVPDQLVDRTSGLRRSSFFDNTPVAHAAFADPYCPDLRSAILSAGRRTGETVMHDGGTYCCIEGPQFSTRAESELYRSWGLDVIGMTASPEAKLAREAELCYAGLSLVTDYDCWHDTHDSVEAHTVASVMARNVIATQRLLLTLVPGLTADTECSCSSAMEYAVLTDTDAVSTEPGTYPWQLARKYRSDLA
ncbi:5'-methylthioadenosine phosphorylase [Actinopolyspora mzabensis]|uniref:S-methyl-5'-thioadenosine phosphorylase n=1 Tax=Actinopolyspora mzabensis TaxID=995066 RepID=A0A1G9FQS4_ACTMZ|nr:S-methyl-5'-thioadenosine phosphorylase [Actinopolyspora mzabensis]SDK90758.1 5'-methylthioadenosine phosphorylase [Actinopolyspora mzabensis]